MKKIVLMVILIIILPIIIMSADEKKGQVDTNDLWVNSVICELTSEEMKEVKGEVMLAIKFPIPPWKAFADGIQHFLDLRIPMLNLPSEGNNKKKYPVIKNPTKEQLKNSL